MARPWDRLPPKDQARLQAALLHDLLTRYVYPFSPFYRRLFDQRGIKPGGIKRLRDLERVPMVSRWDFAATEEDRWRPFRAMLRPDERSLKRWAHRRTLRRVALEKLLRGDLAAERLLAEEFKPVHLHVPDRAGPVMGYTMRDLSALSQAGARSLVVMGADRSDVLVSTLPYGPTLPFWHVHYAAQGGGLASLHLGAGESVRPARAAHWMHRAAASILASQPGYAEGLLRGAPPETFARLRVLALWGQGGMQGARERFTARLRAGGAPDAYVVSMLGIPEARVAWAECPPPANRPEASHGYHTYPDLEYLQVIDPSSGKVQDEERGGELVYTSLDWRGSVLIRYRTGVMAKRGITTKPCPGCGRTVPRILPELSFTDWLVRTVGSQGEVRVDLAEVLPVLWEARGVPLWQIEVARGAGPDRTDLVTAYLGGASERDVPTIETALRPFGVRARSVPLQDLGRRMGMGTERLEERVVIRHEPSAPPPP
ncbi:MAG TPA: hypothetical protein VMP42_08220 [Actinomycetota bacterium]|nr:hypothetical protein [Actinomycetota bacterium]